MVTQGHTATLVAGGFWPSADRVSTTERSREAAGPLGQYDEQIHVACGEKPAYGYRRVTW